MATELLLMADVADLGVLGDLVTVADGYARNYLMPQKLAEPVTEAARRRLVRLHEKRVEDLKAQLADAKAVAKSLEGVSVTVKVKTGEEGKLYGSVGTTDIAAALEEQGFSFDSHSVLLDAPLKDLGVTEVALKLHPELNATIKVWVVGE